MIDVNKMYLDKQFKVNKTDEYSYLAGCSDVLFEISNNIKKEISMLDEKLKHCEKKRNENNGNSKNKGIEEALNNIEYSVILKKATLMHMLSHCL